MEIPPAAKKSEQKETGSVKLSPVICCSRKAHHQDPASLSRKAEMMEIFS